jgi:hypothetical protein
MFHTETSLLLTAVFSIVQQIGRHLLTKESLEICFLPTLFSSRHVDQLVPSLKLVVSTVASRTTVSTQEANGESQL